MVLRTILVWSVSSAGPTAQLFTNTTELKKALQRRITIILDNIFDLLNIIRALVRAMSLDVADTDLRRAGLGGVADEVGGMHDGHLSNDLVPFHGGRN
jgi:hypothetical protein